MIKRKIIIEGLAVAIIVITIFTAINIVPIFKQPPLAINLGVTVAKALEQASVHMNEQFRYIHITSVESNGDLNEQQSEIKLWGLGGNGRMDMVSKNIDTNESAEMSLLLISNINKSCLALNKQYECGSLDETKHNFYNEMLQHSPFSIINPLKEGKVDLSKPLEQHNETVGGKTVLRVLYPFPVEYQQSNIEKYVEIVLDPATQTVFSYKLMNEQKELISKVTFLENKVVRDLDPAMFFTEQYWKNELRLIPQPPTPSPN
ncbi:MAG: hypothetical protein WCW27_02580 [Patescibacteria group bacterium]|jgi:hypothetical protein